MSVHFIETYKYLRRARIYYATCFIFFCVVDSEWRGRACAVVNKLAVAFLLHVEVFVKI